MDDDIIVPTTSNGDDELVNKLITQVFTVDSGARLVSVIKVTKLTRRGNKKPKKRILCITVKQNVNKTKVRFYTVKEENGAYSIIKKHKLKILKRVDGHEKFENEFVLHFEQQRPLHVGADSVESRNVFLYRLLQLCKDFCGFIPEVNNINVMELSMYAAEEDNNMPLANKMVLGDAVQIQQKDLVTPDEERNMQELLSIFNIDISDAKAFAQRLGQELNSLEKANIHEILDRQTQWKDIINQIEDAVEQLAEMENWINGYNFQLKIMRKDIEQIEAENNSKEIQARNHLRLAEEVETLLRKLDLPKEYVNSLERERFDTNEGLVKIVYAIRMLEEALEGELKDGMFKMAAVGERIGYFQSLRLKLVNRLREFLKDEFIKLSTKMMSDKSRLSRKDSIKLEPHTLVYDHLQNYFPLMKSVKSTDFSAHLDLKKSYEHAMHMVYKKELSTYFAELKAQIKKDKDSMSNHDFLLGSGEANLNSRLFRLYLKANSGNRNSVSDYYDDDELSDSMSVISTTDGESIRVDKAFLTLLNNVTDVIYREQRFCSQFFDLNPQLELGGGGSSVTPQAGATASASTPPSSSGSASTTSSAATTTPTSTSPASSSSSAAAAVAAATTAASTTPTATATATTTTTTSTTAATTAPVGAGFKELKTMLDKMFRNVLHDFYRFVDSFEHRSDRFYSLMMLLATEKKIDTFKTRSAYITNMLQQVHAKLLDVFNKFIKAQLASIEEYKCVIKKSGVVPYIAKFPYFLDRFQSMIPLDAEEMVVDSSDPAAAAAADRPLSHAEGAYVQIVNKMFECLDALAETEPKHSDAFRMKNYCYFYRTVAERNLNHIPELMKRVEEAKNIFNSCTDRYINWIIDGQFHDLFEYFTGIEEALKTRTMEAEDIHTQRKYYKTELRALIKATSSGLEKGIAAMVKRMDKHIGPKSETASYVVLKVNDYNLYQEVWQRLTSLFLRRYETFESLVSQCYANEKMSPTAAEVKKVFERIEAKVPALRATTPASAASSSTNNTATTTATNRNNNSSSSSNKDSRDDDDDDDD